MPILPLTPQRADGRIIKARRFLAAWRGDRENVPAGDLEVELAALAAIAEAYPAKAAKIATLIARLRSLLAVPRQPEPHDHALEAKIIAGLAAAADRH